MTSEARGKAYIFIKPQISSWKDELDIPVIRITSFRPSPLQRIFWHIVNRTIDEGHEFDKKKLIYGFMEKEHRQRYEFASGFVEEGGRIADLACSDGYGSIILSKKAKEVFAVDVRGIYEKRPREGRPENVRFVKQDVVEFLKNPRPRARFDSIVALETIEHLPDHLQFLSLCKRRLKRKGSLVISTPNYLITETFCGSVANPYHVREFHTHEMRGILEEVFGKAPAMYAQWPVDPERLVLSSLYQFMVKKEPRIVSNDGSVVGLNNLFVVRR